MPNRTYVVRKTIEFLWTYWAVIRIIVPITVAAHLLSEIGFIEAAAPTLSIFTDLYDLPPEIAFAWLTGLLVGMWAGATVLFTVVPVSELTTADLTVYSALLVFTHGIPIEQKIIQKAGPGFFATTPLRLAGGLIFAALLHLAFTTTGWLSGPLQPVVIPAAADPGWVSFMIGLVKTMLLILVLLLSLAWILELLKLFGLLDQLNAMLAPLLAPAGIQRETRSFVALGLLLGIVYGAGLLIKEAQSGRIDPRQIFLASVFMGFAHGMIEDTIIVLALGADFWSVFVARLVFAILATAAIGLAIRRIPDRWFLRCLFSRPPE